MEAIYETPTSINNGAHSKVDLSIIPTDTSSTSRDKYVSYAEYINFGKLKGFGITGMPGTDYYWNNADKEITWPEFVEVLNNIINKLHDEATSGGTEKQTPDLYWSSNTATATINETNTYPTLTNTDNVEVTYDSSNTSVATIALDGTITLLTAGTTTISAIFAGNSIYAAKTVSYLLTVNQVQSVKDIYIGIYNPNDGNVGKNVSLSDLDKYNRYTEYIDASSNYLYVLIPNNWNYELDKISFGSGILMFSQITSNDTNYTLYKTDSTLNGASDISFIFKIKNATPDDNPQEDDKTIYVEFGDIFGDENNIKYTLNNGTADEDDPTLYEYTLSKNVILDNKYLYIKLNNGDSFYSVTNSTGEAEYTFERINNEPTLYRSVQPFTARSINLIIKIITS